MVEAEEEETREERGGRWHYILMLVKPSRRVACASWRSSVDCISADLIGDLEAFRHGVSIGADEASSTTLHVLLTNKLLVRSIKNGA